MFKNSMMVVAAVAALVLVAPGCKPVGQGGAPATPAPQAQFSSPEEGKCAFCQNHLKQLGLGCKLYAAEHNDRFPDALQALYPEYCPDRDNYRCPNSTQPLATSADAANVSDYEIVAGLTEKSPANTVLIREKSTANHTPAGRNVLYVDGHVEFIAGAQ